jgi:hypothetical protein
LDPRLILPPALRHRRRARPGQARATPVHDVISCAPMEPAAPPSQPVSLGLRPRVPRIYYAIFIPLGLLGFSVSFYLTYRSGAPLPLPPRLPLPALSFPVSTAPPHFEEGTPPAPPAPQASPAASR